MLSDEGLQWCEQARLNFALPDDLAGIYRQFDIDLGAVNGSAGWVLPLPARYVVDGDGVVRHAAVNADYTARPEPSETLAALKSLVGQA